MNNIKNTRDKNIDRFRGLLVFCMVFFQYLNRFDSVGILKQLASHGSDGVVLFGNLRLADIFAPAFFFCIGLTYIPSLRRRIEIDGRRKAYLHFITRYLCILGLGYAIDFTELVLKWWTQEPLFYITFIFEIIVILSSIALLIFTLAKKESTKISKILNGSLAILGLNCVYVSIGYSRFNYLTFETGLELSSWNTLQAIGGAGLLMILLAEAPTLIRFFSSIVIFYYFTFYHELPNHMQIIDKETQGGLSGLPGWLIILIMATVMADLYYKDLKNKTHYYDIALLVSLVIAIIGGFTFYINKGSVSPGYILVNLFISPFAFKIVCLFNKVDVKFNFLTWWGYSAILMYLCQFIFNNVLFEFAGFLYGLSTIPAILFTIVVNGFLTFVAYTSYKKKQVRF